MTRLDAATETTARPLRNHSRPLRACCECGEHFEAMTCDASFCADKCRKAFNNRRMVRGAEVYDLLMALRYDRKAATILKVWKLVNRLCALHRAQDVSERGGRPSWRPPAEIIARRPYLKADTLSAVRH